MAERKPRISFNFPYRWLVEEKEFLGKRLVDQAKRSSLSQIYHPDLDPGPPLSYQVVLKYHSYQPVKVPITQKQVEKFLKDLFPSGRCVSFQTFFVQTNSPTMLPVMEFEIYY